MNPAVPKPGKKKPTRNVRARRAGLIFGPLADFVRGKTCVGCRRRPGVPHHVHARGMGGATWDWLQVYTSEHVLTDLIGNLAPVCKTCHDEIHVSLGRHSFGEKHNTDLSIEAEAYGEVFKKNEPGKYAKLLLALDRL